MRASFATCFDSPALSLPDQFYSAETVASLIAERDALNREVVATKMLAGNPYAIIQLQDQVKLLRDVLWHESKRSSGECYEMTLNALAVTEPKGD